MLTAHLPAPTGFHANDIALINLEIYGGGLLHQYRTESDPVVKDCLRWCGLDFARYVRNGVATLARRWDGDDFAAHFYTMTQPLAELCHPSHDDDAIESDPTPALILDLHYETQAEIRALRKIVENLTQRRDSRSTAQTERRGA